MKVSNEQIRRIEVRLPVTLAIKYEYLAIKNDLSLPQYLLMVLSDINEKSAGEKIDQMHKMISQLHSDYFETED